MLFATLDPTLRSIDLPHGTKAILSDTVGFISELPTMLVAAFRATLEEVIEADVILHVRDVSHEDTQAQLHDVESVLRSLGIEPKDPRIIEVWNKIDRLDAAGRTRDHKICRSARVSEHPAILVSALTGEGTDALLAAIEDRLGDEPPDPASVARRRRWRRRELASPQYRSAGEIVDARTTASP